MLFHSRKERGDPEPEFEGDSGGRYSICVNLGEGDGFYWLKQDDGESTPVRGEEGVALLETHCHSAFYDVEDPSTAKACVGG